MTPRAIAMHTLLQVARHASFPDVLLDIYLKEHPDLDPRDRALVTELVYGVLRWQGRLDWISKYWSGVEYPVYPDRSVFYVFT